MLAAIAALPPGQRERRRPLLPRRPLARPDRRAPRDLRRRGQDPPAQGPRRAADPPRRPPEGASRAMPASVPMHVADIRDTAATTWRATSSCSRSDDGARRLPIWIGAPEATTLAARLHDVEHAAARHLPLRRRPARAPPASRLRGGPRSCGSPTPIFYAEARARVAAPPSTRGRATRSTSRSSTGAPILVDEARARPRPPTASARSREELARALASERDSRAIAADERERIAALPYGPEDAPRA